MNIFCRETQAHLALHGISATIPGSTGNTSTAGGLITPELWLRDCRSPPPSPVEENLVVDDEPGSGPSTYEPEVEPDRFPHRGKPRDSRTAGEEATEENKSASIHAIVRTFDESQDKAEDTDGDTFFDGENRDSNSSCVCDNFTVTMRCVDVHHFSIINVALK